MRLTTKGRYGMRLVIDIAQHEKWGPVSMAETSLRQDISAKYLERLVGELQRAGLVRSIRGREGGHMLGLPPEKITVGDVVRVLEGESAQLACSSNRLSCPRSVNCLTRAIWVAADQAMFEKLDSVTVRDIMEDGQNCLARKEATRLKRLKPAAEPTPGQSVLGQSEPGQGATGAAATQAETAQRKKTARRVLRQRLAQHSGPPPRPEGAPKKVMVVDDDPDIVDYLTQILREHGYAVCAAQSGSQAMDTLLSERPDLITLDLEMPEEWGPKFHQRYSRIAELRDIPVVVISGLPGIHRAIRKAVATVSKPFDPAEVLHAVEGAIGTP